MADDLLLGAYRGPGGFIAAPGSLSYGNFLNANVVVQSYGMIVRAGAAPGDALLAQADVIANLLNILGARTADVAVGASAPVAPFEDAGTRVRMNIQPLIGGVVYLSAAVAGIGTQTAPALALPLGICYAAVQIGGIWYADLLPLIDDTTASSLDTLANTYAVGVNAADQTMIIRDVDGGAVVINGTTPGLVTPTVFEINVIGGTMNFYTRGGFDVFSSISRAAAAGTVWDQVAFLASTITLTGGPAVVTALAQIHVGAGIVNGAGNTASDAYDLLIDAGPAGTATITRAWSLGAVGNAQLQAQTAMGGAVLIPTNTLAIVASKTIAAPVAISVWRGLDFQASTLTLTAGGVAPSELSAVYFAAPVITQTAGAVYTVPVAATVTIAGPPAAGAGGGATPTITNPIALLVNSGRTALNGTVGISIGTNTPQAYLDVGGTNLGGRSLLLRSGDSSVPPADAIQILFGYGGSADYMHNIRSRHDGATIYGNAVDVYIWDRNVDAAANPGTFHCVTFGGAGLGVRTTGPTSPLHVVASMTIAVPVALDTWKGVNFAASTLTLAAGGVAPTTLSEVYFAAPVITSPAAYVIPTAATVTIAGPPTAGGALTITNPAVLNIEAGVVLHGPSVLTSKTNVGGTITFDINYLFGGVLPLVRYVFPASGEFRVLEVSVIGVQDIFFQASPGGGGYGCLETDAGLGMCLGTATATPVFIRPNRVTRMEINSAGNVGIGVSPAAASRLHVVATQTIASAAGAVYDGVKFAADTLTITGGPGAITALTKFLVEGPTVTSAAANVATDFYTTRIGIATFAGVGPASATRNWSLYIEGNTRFGGGQTVPGKQILIGASPYGVLETDYVLEVQSNGGAITINLPALTGGTQLNGRVIIIKDSGYSAAASNITIARGNVADKINNVAGSYTINVSGTCLWLKANTTNNDWEIV